MCGYIQTDRLTSSTVIDRPVFTFIVTFTGGQILLGRPIPRGWGLPQHVRVKRGHGSVRMEKSCVIPPC